MVSLTVVEQLALRAWADGHHAAVSLTHPKKGEEIILLTTQKSATLKELTDVSEGLAAINLPRKIFTVDAIPLLGAGKTDYAKATELAAKLNA
jgi:acyl-[acyl-carrier-protein]-phospholipid O-acyltransferase/long-chain-fatty-acid--[acyl-carrier-protein] ligase